MRRRHRGYRHSTPSPDRKPWASERMRRLKLLLGDTKDARARVVLARALEGVALIQEHPGAGATTEDWLRACATVDKKVRRLQLLVAGLAAGRVGLQEALNAAIALEDAQSVAQNLAHLSVLAAAAGANEGEKAP